MKIDARFFLMHQTVDTCRNTKRMKQNVRPSEWDIFWLLISLFLSSGCTAHKAAENKANDLQPIQVPQTLYEDETMRSFWNYEHGEPCLRHPEPANIITVDAIVTAAHWPFFDSPSFFGERKVQFEITRASPRLSYKVGDRLLFINFGDRTARFFVPYGQYRRHFELVFQSDGRLYGIRNMKGEYFEQEPAPSTQPLSPNQPDDLTTHDRVVGWMKILEKLTDIKHLLMDIVSGDDPNLDSYFLQVKES